MSPNEPGGKDGSTPVHVGAANGQVRFGCLSVCFFIVYMFVYVFVNGRVYYLLFTASGHKKEVRKILLIIYPPFLFLPILSIFIKFTKH